MTFLITAAIVFVLAVIVGWFVVDFSHLGGNSRRPGLSDYVPMIIAALVIAVVAGALVDYGFQAVLHLLGHA